MAEDKNEKAAAAARALLAAESVGLLSTISVRRAGTPYGSLTPYALSATGAPLLLLEGTLLALFRRQICNKIQ